MRTLILVVPLAAILIVIYSGVALSHCEIPCGIYGDKMRVATLYEHMTTIEKSMKMIGELSGKSNSGDVQSINQVVRWVTNKEEHASQIQHIVTQYFLTQRVKPAKAGDAAGEKKYTTQLTTLHGMLVGAMKCKQTVDPANVAKLRDRLKAFSEAYFNAKDLEHLKEHHGG